MKATPKLQDSLEIFLDKLTDLDIKMDRLNELPYDLDAKISTLKNLPLKPDGSELRALYSDLLNKLIDEKNRVIDKADLTIERIDQLNKQQEQRKREGDRKYMFYVAVFAILFGALAFAFGIMYYQKTKLIETKNEYYLMNQSFREYIETTDQTTHFENWRKKQLSQMAEENQ